MSNEAIRQHLAETHKQLNIAEHMLITTYPVVNDPKLLVSVVETLDKSLSSALMAFLTQERFYRRIPAFSQSMEGMLVVLTTHSSRKHKFATNIASLAQDLQDTLQAQKDASVVFTRKEKFVTTDNDMRVRELTLQQTKDFLAKTKVACKELIDKTEVHQ